MNSLDDLKREFGYVPDSVAQVVARLWARVRQLEPPRPQDLGYAWIHSGVAHSTTGIEALIDARSILTAFSREIANPRPTLGDLAKAQGISLSTLRRRYTGEQVKAIRHLIDDTGYIDDIIGPFSSLFDLDLRGVSASRDAELSARDEIAELYAQREDELAEQLGVETRADLTPPEGSEDLLPPLPAYFDKPDFEPGKLYPGRRRRLLSDYNPRVISDALENASHSLRVQWGQWTVESPPQISNSIETEEETDEPPF